jgi:hypothetical protein
MYSLKKLKVKKKMFPMIFQSSSGPKNQKSRCDDS